MNTNSTIEPALLLRAYAMGVFPMADRHGRVGWYDPDPRAIIPLDSFHVPRRLARTLRNGGFEIRIDYDFEGVIAACAAPAPDQPERAETWITPGLIASYLALHRLGYAHSVEAYRDGQLAGGLYGVALRGLFAGESMFSRARDASKVALVALVARLRAGGYLLLDTQFLTAHLAGFGAVEIPRVEYQRRLAEALVVDASWPWPGAS
jgi:leucyl/phenylalanyl-tRNA---protein transferase